MLHLLMLAFTRDGGDEYDDDDGVVGDGDGDGDVGDDDGGMTRG